MSRTIERSVGRRGANRYNDTKTIQQMLNNVPVSTGGPAPPLDDDGDCGKLTKGAIFNFQLTNFGWQGADGRVDPGHATLTMLQIYDDIANKTKEPPKPKIPEPPRSHDTNQFLVRPAVFKTPFGSKESDWFFEFVAIPHQHTGIYYFQEPRAVQPVEPPARFAKQFVILKTKHAHSPFDFSGDAIYLTHDKGNDEHDRSLMMIKHKLETVHMEWRFNHLFKPTKNQPGSQSMATQGEFILVKRIINSAVL